MITLVDSNQVDNFIHPASDNSILMFTLSLPTNPENLRIRTQGGSYCEQVGC